MGRERTRAENKMNPIKLAYLVAVAQLEAVTAEYNASDAEFDVDFEAAGEPEDFKAFYAAWSAENPKRAANAQRLCALQNEARVVLTAAENAVLDWCFAAVAPIAVTKEQREALAIVRGTKSLSARRKAVDLAMRFDG
jgi:hypothetical protein